eukprot:763418-Hanusia_phi.AAC.4
MSTSSLSTDASTDSADASSETVSDLQATCHIASERGEEKFYSLGHLVLRILVFAAKWQERRATLSTKIDHC